MAVVVKNRIEQFRAQIPRASRQGLMLAGRYMMREHMEAVSVPNTGVSVKRKRDTSAGKKGSSYTIYPHPSKPGEYPRLRTGAGRSNVFAKDGGGAANPWTRVGVGANGIHLFWLESGTRYLARRLGLIQTLTDHRQRMGEIALGPIKEALK